MGVARGNLGIKLLLSLNLHKNLIYLIFFKLIDFI